MKRLTLNSLFRLFGLLALPFIKLTRSVLSSSAMKGLGALIVRRDDEVALQEWEQGLARAQDTLERKKEGRQEESGDGEFTLEQVRLAAEQGDAKAQCCLGMMYFYGRGVPQNNVYAHMWLNIAASNGDKQAGELRDDIAEGRNSYGAIRRVAIGKGMTREEIVEAQRLAVECEKKGYKDC